MPVFSFRTLGALDLQAESGGEQTGVLSGQKLVALLAYLCIARPRGLHRRDTIVALLWGELDQDRARAALRHAAYRLRRSLGAEAIINRGDEDIGVDPAIVRCDAVEFETLLDAGSVAEALAVYRGDLLPGFFVPAAPEFERWLDGERSRLRSRASSSAWELATRRAAAGSSHEAADWARRALSFAPDDERLLRRVLTLLAETGDTAGALREYERFADRVRVEYDAVPSAETAALAAALRRPADPTAGRGTPAPTAAAPTRAAAATGSAAGQTPASAPTVGSAAASPSAPFTPQVPAQLPADAVPSAPSLPARRTTRLLIAAGLAATIIAIALTGRELGLTASASDPPASPTIAVLPFEVRGSRDLEYLREGLPDLLSIGLDGAGGISTADPRGVLALVRQGDGALDERAAGRIAERVGAQLYVSGSVVEAGGKLAITATLHDRRGRVRAVARTRTAEVGRLFELVDELARQLLADELGGPAADLVRLAARTTKSLPALRAFLDGERAIRGGRHAAALEAFQQAVTEDSTFALAYYRLGAAGRWMTEYALANQAADRAAQYASALPSYARRLLTASHAVRRGAYAEAESLYRAGIASRPADVDAWFGLGDLFYHYNALRGRSKGEGRSAFERALSIDPEDGQSRLHLLELMVWEGNVARVDSLLGGLPPGSDFAAKWPSVRALIVRDTAAQRATEAGLRELDDRALVRVVIHSASAFPSNLAGAARLLEVLTDPSRSSGWRAYGHHLRAQVELARGRWSAARVELTAMGALEPAAATEYGALLSVAPFLPVDTTALRALRAALVSWDPVPTPPSSNSVFALHNGMHVALRHYLLGLVSVRLGDTTDALRHAEALVAAPGDSIRSLVARNLAAAIRARVAQYRGDPEAALAVLGEPWLDPRTHASHRSSIFSQVSDRYLRAELLRESGRLAEAVAAYGAVADYSVDGLMYLAHSHLRRAEIYDRLGDARRAAMHRKQFIALWSECDPELVPARLVAERQLASAGRGAR